MSGKGMLRGYLVHFDGEEWRFSDTDEATEGTWFDRPCGHCGLHNTPEGHDGCLGTLPGVMNACCGHGSVDEAYIQPCTGSTVRGSDALALVKALRVAPVEPPDKEKEI